MFDEMPHRNVVTWNSLISGYLQAGFSETALGLFFGMLKQGIKPSAFGVSAGLVGCTQLYAGELGVQIHGLSLKCGVSSNLVVGTGLIDMYAKCWNLEESRQVFDLMRVKNAITWTAMIASYAYHKLPYKALFLFREMQRLGLRSDCVTCNGLLSSFYGVEHLDHCKQIHCLILREGLESNAYIRISLVTVYAECKCSLEEFDKICLIITTWDQVSWNALIAGFSHLDCGEKGLECFRNMRHIGIASDSFTVTTVLRAVGIGSSLEMGKLVHALAFKLGLWSNLHVQNGLLSMYGRCGLIRDSKQVFFEMIGHDLISWNSLLAAYSHHGFGEEVIELFKEMKRTSIQPDQKTFTSVLTACSHAGMIDKGLEYFELLRELDLSEPLTMELYASIADMFGRAGYVHEAEAFINSMPIQPGPSIYKSLLSACKMHGNIEVGTRASTKLLEQHPNETAAYVLLSNTLATRECWDEAEGTWKKMQSKRMKRSGYSWVESSN